MGFFGMVLKPGQKEAVEVPPGWCLQLCTAALEPAKAGGKPRDVSATLWVQVEGDIGDTIYLLGSLQGGGPCAQIGVGHCLTSIDGEVILEARGGGVVHLTGFFNREFDPDLEQEDESSEEEEEEQEEDSDEEPGMGEKEDGEEEEEEEEEEEGSNGNGNGSLSNRKEAGRRVRSAAAAAALVCGTGDGENSEDDSEVDGEYVPGEGEDDDDDEDDDDMEEDGDDAENKDEEDGDEENDESMKNSNGNSDGNDKKRAASAEGSAAAASAASPSPSQQRPPKKSRLSAAAVAGAGEAGSTASPAEDGQEGDAITSKMTKQERKRQRKKENKRKALEAKKSLEEAFREIDSDDGGKVQVGIPLKNPRSKTLKGGLKIKDTTFGGGKMAVPGKNVKVCYEGCFPDGRVFDKNNNRRRPLQFRVGMQSVIVGMDRGVEGMRVGGSREISIPAALGYGARGTGPIPANQDLVFRVELIDVLGK